MDTQVKEQVEKKAYNSPHIVEYGDLVELTQGGLGAPIDVESGFAT